MKAYERINKIAIALKELDCKGADFKITKLEYEDKKNDLEILEILTGEKPNYQDWDKFKEKFIIYQRQNGFEWVKSKGQFGALSLMGVNLDKTVGQEIAELLMSENHKEGELTVSLKSKLINLYDYLRGNNPPEINYDEAKNGFRSFSLNNKKYRFRTKANKYIIGSESFVYDGSEKELGDVIFLSLKTRLGLDYLTHSQTKRSEKKFLNCDFEGYKIKKLFQRDEIEFYNFELKPSNKIESVSDAINQALNYKDKSNYTFIIIPNFSDIEDDRSDDFRRRCVELSMGIISIDFVKDNKKEIEDISIVLDAPWRKFEDTNTIQQYLNSDIENPRTFCPLCQKIVEVNDREKNCGWKHSVNSRCMKEFLEQLPDPTSV